MTQREVTLSECRTLTTVISVLERDEQTVPPITPEGLPTPSMGSYRWTQEANPKDVEMFHV